MTYRPCQIPSTVSLVVPAMPGTGMPPWSPHRAEGAERGVGVAAHVVDHTAPGRVTSLRIGEEDTGGERFVPRQRIAPRSGKCYFSGRGAASFARSHSFKGSICSAMVVY